MILWIFPAIWEMQVMVSCPAFRLQSRPLALLTIVILPWLTIGCDSGPRGADGQPPTAQTSQAAAKSEFPALQAKYVYRECGFVSSLAFLPGRDVLAIPCAAKVVLWEFQSGKKTECCGEHPGHIHIALSSSGKLLATGSGDWNVEKQTFTSGEVVLYDLEKRAELYKKNDHSENVCSLAFSPDGTMVVAGDRDGKVIVWSTESGKKLLALTTRGTACVAFSPDSKILAAGGMLASEIDLWDVSADRKVDTLTCKDVYSLVFTSSGRHLVNGGGNRKVTLIGVRDHKETALEWKYGIECFAVSPDGKIVAGGDRNGNVILWEVSTQKVLIAFRAHGNSAMWALAFDATCKYLASANSAYGFDDKGTEVKTKVWDIEEILKNNK